MSNAGGVVGESRKTHNPDLDWCGDLDETPDSDRPWAPVDPQRETVEDVTARILARYGGGTPEPMQRSAQGTA